MMERLLRTSPWASTQQQQSTQHLRPEKGSLGVRLRPQQAFPSDQGTPHAALPTVTLNEACAAKPGPRGSPLARTAQQEHRCKRRERQGFHEHPPILQIIYEQASSPEKLHAFKSGWWIASKRPFPEIGSLVTNFKVRQIN